MKIAGSSPVRVTKEQTMPVREPLTPKCCPDIQRTEAILLEFSDEFFDGDVNARPTWRLQMSFTNNLNAIRALQKTEGEGLELHRDQITEVYEEWWNVKFCPFCSTALPDIEMRKECPKNICVISDGGYYCDTCKERLHACECLPPDHRWKIIKDEENG